MWKRISNLFSKPEPPKVEKSMLQLAPGDICEVSLVTYEVTGRVHNRGRNAVVLTLQDGSTIAYLHIEERETVQYALYTPIDGRLDSPDEVPSIIDLDDHVFHLEEEYGDMFRLPVEPLLRKAGSSTYGNTNRMTTSCCGLNGRTGGLCCMKARK